MFSSIRRKLCLSVFICLLSLTWTSGQNIGFNSGVPGGNQGTQTPFRPFGSDRPCSVLINETLNQNDGQLIIERVLITADTMGNTFSSSSFTGGSNQQLDIWAAQTCGQMQNVIGYLKSACQFSTSGSSISSVSATSQTELVAQKKLSALNAVKDYLCSNNQVFLKELAMNNGAQCAKRTDLKEFGCNIQQGSQPTFIQMLPSTNPQVLKYGTAIILSMNSYNGDDCKYLSDVTGCILDKYNRGSDFCSLRASTHFGRIFDVMLQGVQCKSGGYSTFNTFDNSNNNNFNGNNPTFNRFPSNSGNFPNNQNNFGSSSNFPQQNPNFPQNSFGMSNNNNWPSQQNQNGFGMNSGSNWPQNQNSFGMNSGSNWPNPSNSFGQNSGMFGQSSNNMGQNSGFSSGGTIPPYNPNNRRPYGSGGNTLQAAMTMAVTTILAVILTI